jgi:hypothetical protein
VFDGVLYPGISVGGFKGLADGVLNLDVSKGVLKCFVEGVFRGIVEGVFRVFVLTVPLGSK